MPRFTHLAVDSVVLPQFNLVAFESRIVELSPLLDANGVGGEPLGFLNLDYNGVVLGLGAQLTLYPGDGDAGVDSPRSLSIDFSSGNRQAAFWLPPNAEATLALTNMSTAPISVHLQCGRVVQDLSVSAHNTSVQTFFGEQLAAVGGLPLNGMDGVAAACELSSSSSDITGLRSVGHVEKFGYHAPIRFYDPATATSQSLTAPGLLVKARTHVVVHNTTGRLVVVNGVLREATLNEPKTSSRLVVALPPHATTQLDTGAILGELALQHVDEATLTLETEGSQGALVAALTQDDEGLFEDIPLRTANPKRFSAGAYPLRWEQDYTNRVSVTNTAAKVLKARALITAGSITYTLPVETIPPGRTKVYDVDELRRDRVKDVNGKVLPMDAIYGKFMWHESGIGQQFGLMGRNSVTSRLNKRKSSFSCGFGCSFSSDRYPVFLDSNYVGPIRSVAYGSTYGENIYEVLQTSGPTYTYPYSYSAIDLSTTINGVINFGQSSGSSTAYGANAVGAGKTHISYLYSYDYPTTDEFGDCNDPGYTQGFVGGDGGATPTVSISGPYTVAVVASGTNGAGNQIQLVASGNPSGGTYSWTSSGNISLSNTSSSTVTATGTNGGPAAATVTYTLNGASTSTQQQITVQKPTSLANSVANVSFDCRSSDPSLRYHTIETQIAYQVRDQNDNTIQVAGMPVYESFTAISNSCAGVPNVPNATSGNTDANGNYPNNDLLFMCSPSCLPVNNEQPTGSCQVKVSQTWHANGFSVQTKTVAFACTGVTFN